MVVFHDTYTHALVCWDFTELRYVYIVEIFHPDRFLVRFITCIGLYGDGDAGGFQFLYCAFLKAASFFPPEFYAYFEFVQIIFPRFFGKGSEQEVHVFLP